MRKILALTLLFASTTQAQDIELSADRFYSPYTGSDLFISGLRGYQMLDDSIASSSFGNQCPSMNLIRGGKFLFEFTLSHYAMIAQHHIFGHGYRAREFKLPNIRYTIRPFSGATGVPTLNYNSLHINQKTAFTSAGFESTGILASQLEKAWINEGTIDRREAILYLVNSFDTTRQIFRTKNNDVNTHNDVVQYIQQVNTWQGARTLRLSNLKMKTAWNLLDPMLYFSAYSIGKYLWSGDPSVQMPILQIGCTRFMPGTRTLFAPWGPELQLQNHFYTEQNKYIGLFVRGGRTGGVKSYGVDLQTKPLEDYGSFGLEHKISIWYQPHVLKGTTAATTSNKYGMAQFLGLIYKFNHTVSSIAEIGYKNSGFLPGTPLEGGTLYKVGLRFNY